MAPRVSAIIPVYNAWDYIRATVDSVLAQTYSEVEVVVVDDASTDGTADILKAYGDAITYLRQENTGVSAARNRAIRASTGELLAFIDHDDLWYPTKLERQVALFQARPDLGLVYSNCEYINGRGDPRGEYLAPGRQHRGRVLAVLFLDCFVPLLTAVVRRDVFDEVGEFNRRWSIAEDYDLFLRVAERYEVDFVDAPLAGYRVHGENASRDVRRMRREEIEVIRACLARNPQLRSRLGAPGVRMRTAGLRMDVNQALWLAGRGDKGGAGPPLSLPRQLKTLLMYLASWTGPGGVIRLQSGMSRWRRRGRRRPA